MATVTLELSHVCRMVTVSAKEVTVKCSRWESNLGRNETSTPFLLHRSSHFVSCHHCASELLPPEVLDAGSSSLYVQLLD